MTRKRKSEAPSPKEHHVFSSMNFASHLGQISLHGWHVSQKNLKTVSMVALLMETANAA